MKQNGLGSARRGLWVAVLLAVIAASGVLASVHAEAGSSGLRDSTAIRVGVKTFLGEPAVVYPICISRKDRDYARAGVYPVPVNYTVPFQVVLHRSGAVWRVVAWRDYDPLGWIKVGRYPSNVVREPWCQAVPHTPADVRAALRAKRAVVSRFGMTFPYVPVVGAPLYKPGSLGFSGDGGTIYDIDKWLAYGRRSALARAGWVYNPCTPDCATGRPRTSVTFVLELTNPEPCRDVTAFTTLTVSQSSNTKLLPNKSRSLMWLCTN